MGIPGAANPLLLRRAAAAADDAYQLEKSLRFNDPDSPKLTRTAGKGDTRKWTYSTWVKRGKITDQAPLLSGKTSPYQDIYFTGGDAIACYIDSPNVNVRTSRIFKDPGAWMHIVIVWDTAQVTNSDRLRFYINGKRETSFDATTWPAQYQESVLNRDGKDNAIFHGLTTSNDHFDGYGADPIFIDGLALHPSSFGQFDSARNWNPAEFKLLGRNNGSTWSSQVSGTEDSGWEKTQAFNGNTSNSARGDTGQTLTFTPTTKMERVASLRIFADHRYGSKTASTLLVNGTNYSHLVPKTSGAWVDIPENNLETIAWSSVEAASSGDAIDIAAIEVDGEILMDGANHTDSVTKLSVLPNSADRLNPNNGTVWSDYLVSSTGSFFSNMPATNLFNGNLSNATDASTNSATLTFTPPAAITYNESVILHCAWTHFQTSTAVITHSDDSTTTTTLTNVKKFKVIDTGGGTIKSLALTTSSGYLNLGGIEVDGHLLLDSARDQSFHLKFNDTSTNERIGKDSLNGLLSSASAGLPIYNTTDNYGDTKGSGTRSDSNSGNLLLALPLDATATTSLEATIHGSGSNRSITNESAQAFSTKGRFYGSSIDFGHNSCGITVPASADWARGTGDLTIECWINKNTTSSNDYLLNQTDNAFGFYFNSGGLYHGNFSTGGNNSEQEILDIADYPYNTWFHLSIVKASGSFKVYVNGVLKKTTASNYTVGANAVLQVGNNTAANNLYVDAYVQDLKIYSSAIRSANFTVPSRNDFTVTNLTEATTDTTDLFNVVTYTGNGSNNRGITGVGFQPDFVLVKRTDTTNNWRLSDVMRGSGGDTVLYPDVASGEDQDGNILKSFDTDGFTVGTESHYNGNGAEIAAFCLKAGGAGSSNSDGSITSSVSVNDSKSFSIVTWTGTGSNATVGHGLGKAPDMIWVKKRSESSDTWPVYTNQTGTNGGLSLEQAASKTTDTTWFNDTAPTSTVFSVGTSANTNDSSETFVAYCFANTTGLLKVGGYAGSSSDVTVDVGFTPKLVITKSHDTSGQEWIVKDSVRGTDKILILETNAAQSTARPCTFQSGSFTFTTGQGPTNWNGRNYVYLAIGSVAGGELDVLNDTPTNYEDDNGDVHGNFCTLNPLSSAPDFEFSEGNLHVQSSGSGANSNHYGHGFGTLGVHSSSGGKFYFEVELTDSDRLAYGFGIQKRNYSGNSNTNLVINQGDSTWANNAYTFSGASGSWRNSYEGGGSVNSSYGPNDVEGKVLGFAVDFSNDTTSGGEVFLTVDGTDQGNINSSALKEGLWTPVFFRGSDGDGMAMRFNFGQRSFKHLPSGFKGWCTQNLDDFSSDDSVNDPRYFFDINTYTGTGTGVSNPFRGMKFGPDLIWGKARSYADPHGLCDQIRGVSDLLIPSGYGANSSTSGSYVTAFTSDGYTLGNGVNFNGSSTTYVNWCWDVGTSAATVNTNGSLDPSDAWVNTTSGINILKYTGNGSTSTVGHNLGAKPDLMVIKALANPYSWEVYSSPVGAEYNLNLNSNGDKYDSSERWNDTEPTADVFTLGDYANVNQNGVVFMAYLFTSIPGYSMVGSYEGNGNSVGPFIHTGFKVRYILTKNVDTDSNWRITDTDRADIPFANPQDQKLYSDGDWVEGSGDEIWLMSNGFKILDNDDGFNKSGDTFLFLAFAEHPFKTARAR